MLLDFFGPFSDIMGVGLGRIWQKHEGEKIMIKETKTINYTKQNRKKKILLKKRPMDPILQSVSNENKVELSRTTSRYRKLVFLSNQPFAIRSTSMFASLLLAPFLDQKKQKMKWKITCLCNDRTIKSEQVGRDSDRTRRKTMLVDNNDGNS